MRDSEIGPKFDCIFSVVLFGFDDLDFIQAGDMGLMGQGPPGERNYNYSANLLCYVDIGWGVWFRGLFFGVSVPLT